MFCTDDTGVTYRDASKVHSFDVYEQHGDGDDSFYRVHLDAAVAPSVALDDVEWLYAEGGEPEFVRHTDGSVMRVGYHDDGRPWDDLLSHLWDFAVLDGMQVQVDSDTASGAI